MAPAGDGARTGQGRALSICSNFLPFVTPEAFALCQDFERALYAAL